ncbi:selenoneine biosynthesis selenosugar synthase SenB [Rubrivivax albus]|uniref:TIGR04348 family glycosyltransferase n=1 Tax=Rubrivivax albus TaxID=2499835 RepID=A0A437K1A7_9BURK|nr:selenoneine biosynthesis selenosugar synthase SenB [Rubrivivax albus]RVT54041.1 TIGR04348 family glycosyltransferase [Rubrivivax albus]
MKPILCLVTPALASANNGNWQTARRWAHFLAEDYRVRLCSAWDGAPADVMLALHARRSAPSIHAFAQACPARPLVVALTGTDLYRDIAVDADAQRSLALAWRLIVLHELAPRDLPAAVRGKAVVCFQSTPARATLPKTDRHLRALMVGHLRDEKWPQTLWAAAARLHDRADILIDHIGAPLDPALGSAAQACAAAHPHYRWLGARPHGETLRRIRQAHVLVHTSRMEGGAHVVLEAVRRGTPVLASRIPGNVGMLGADYGGYFPPGDATALATLLQRARDEPAMLKALAVQCDERAPLFDPATERHTLRETLRQALEARP